MKNGKSPGNYKITMEMLKTFGDEGLKIFLEIIDKSWSEEKKTKIRKYV